MAAVNRSLNGLRRQADDAVGRSDGAAPFAQRPDGPGDVALDVAHVTPRPDLTVPVASSAARSITTSAVEPTTGSAAGFLSQSRTATASLSAGHHRRMKSLLSHGFLIVFD